MLDMSTLIQLLIINSIAWFFIHMGMSWLFLQVPDSYYEKNRSWYDPFDWEQNGEIWQKWFGVKHWKDRVPEGSAFIKKTYNKKHLTNNQSQTFKKFILETRRAEQSHWFMMLPAPLFFIWNPSWAGWLMIVYAIVANLPFIIIQRYNRPRLNRLYHRALRKGK